MSSAKKNYVYQILYQILVSILPFITSPYISRVLGVEGIGIYSYTYSIITYFKIFAALGISKYGNRAIAQTRDDKEQLNRTFSSIFALHGILSVIVIGAYMAYWLVFVKANKTIALIQILYLVSELFDINWFYFGLERFKLTVTRNSIIKILTVLAVFVFVKNESHLWVYVLIMAVGNLVSTSAVWYFFSRFARFSKFTVMDMLKHLKPMLVLFFAVIAISVYSYMDKIMLGSMSSMIELGYYENAWKMIEFPVGFIIALGTVMLPKISNLVSKGEYKEIDRYIYESMRFSIVVSVAMAFGLAGIAKEFSVIFWGSDFSASGRLMMILSACVILMSWNGVIRTQYLIPREYDKIYLLAVCSGALINFVVNYMLIPHYGSAGAAVGTVCAYIGICLVQTIYARKDLPIFRYFVESMPYVMIGFVMLITVRKIGTIMGCSIQTLFMEIIVGALVFVILSFGYAFIFKDEFILNRLKQIKVELVRRRRK